MTQIFNPTYFESNTKIIVLITALLPPENPKTKDAKFDYFLQLLSDITNPVDQQNP